PSLYRPRSPQNCLAAEVRPASPRILKFRHLHSAFSDCKNVKDWGNSSMSDLTYRLVRNRESHSSGGADSPVSTGLLRALTRPGPPRRDPPTTPRKDRGARSLPVPFGWPLRRERQSLPAFRAPTLDLCLGGVGRG